MVVNMVTTGVIICAVAPFLQPPWWLGHQQVGLAIRWSISRFWGAGIPPSNNTDIGEQDYLKIDVTINILGNNDTELKLQIWNLAILVQKDPIKIRSWQSSEWIQSNTSQQIRKFLKAQNWKVAIYNI